MRFSFVLGIIFSFMMTSCAYRLGSGPRSIPGGYKSVSVPLFKNKSFEPGIEVSFTNSLLHEFQRAKVAQVVDDALAEARVEGEIISVEYLPGEPKTSNDETTRFLPKGTLLATEYRILLKLSIRIVRISDQIEIWSGNFSGERTYPAPQVTIAGLNSVNPLYNLSARRQNMDLLAKDLMSEAYNRITENF